MQLWKRLTLAALMLAAVSAPLAAAAKVAICRVCVVDHGEGEPEAVKATRTYQGKEYAFCSEKCAKTFDADPAAYVEPEFPRAAPAFALTDLAGKPVSNATLKGKVVLLDFWATWCVPCRKSMPELQALHDKYASHGFTVLGISTDQGGPAKVKKFVEEKKYTYPIAVDSEKAPAWETYGVRAIPAAFLLDAQGRIVAQWTGAPKMSEVEAKLQSMLRVD
jgi:peroxiredoxin